MASAQSPSSTNWEEAVRRIFSASRTQICPYGISCYRMNRNHLRYKKHESLEELLLVYLKTPFNGSFPMKKELASSNVNILSQLKVMQTIVVEESGVGIASETTNQVDDDEEGANEVDQETIGIGPDENEDVTQSCSVCKNPLDHTWALVPCGHAQICDNCSQQLLRSMNHCPICRGPIHNRIKVFL